MIDVEEFQVRGLPGKVSKVRFGDRTVDYWSPSKPGSHLLVAHDGQNILDKRNIGINPHQRATWELAQSGIRMAEKHKSTPPTVICVYHTPYSQDPLGRLKEYTPASFMNLKENWMIENYGLWRGSVEEFASDLKADELLEAIIGVIVPEISKRIGHVFNPEKSALVGASMGGLASIYGVIRHPEFFHSALSFSPHWVIGGDPLAEKMMSEFPAPGRHKLWMSRGTKGLDAKYESAQQLADRVIQGRGYRNGINLRTEVLKRGAHSNATWARYAPEALDFWMREEK